MDTTTITTSTHCIVICALPVTLAWQPTSIPCLATWAITLTEVTLHALGAHLATTVLSREPLRSRCSLKSAQLELSVARPLIPSLVVLGLTPTNRLKPVVVTLADSTTIVLKEPMLRLIFLQLDTRLFSFRELDTPVMVL
jgi:hypothetical protein